MIRDKIENNVRLRLKENYKLRMRLKSRMVWLACMKKKVDKLSECNLLHNIINTPKHTKSLNTHSSNIIQGWMNTKMGKEKFKNFQIILDC